MPVNYAGYLAWCAEFPLRVLQDLDDLAAALKMLRRCLDISRAARTDSQEIYVNALEALIAQFRTSYEQGLRRNGAPDRDVLRYLMLTNGYPVSTHGLVQLAEKLNYPPQNLIAVLDGTDNLCREAINKLAAKFHVPTDLFDASSRCGRIVADRRFHVLRVPGGYVIKDTKTAQEAEAGTGEGCVAIGDMNGDTFMLNPKGIGFREEWEYQLNCEPEHCLAAYFPRTLQEEQEKAEAERAAVRRLNADRRMFYILNHAIPDGGTNEELKVARKGDDQIHEEWYDELDVSHLIAWHQHVRGAYYPSANLLLFYTGTDHTFTDTVKLTACRWLPEVVKALGLGDDVQVGLGTVQGQPGTIWQPMRVWGTVRTVLDTLELCA